MAQALVPLWTTCEHCRNPTTFKAPREFIRHLREKHCTQEGGSFVCSYGYNNVCASLPLEGVSDRDYEVHVFCQHAKTGNNTTSPPPSVVGDIEPTWSKFNFSQNLAAVLNDPGIGKQRDFFTKTWGDQFIEPLRIPACPFLPPVGASDFQSFLKRTSKRYKRLQKRKSSFNVDAEKSLLFPNLQAAKALELSQSSLSPVPPLFLTASFNLGDPSTFQTVLGPSLPSGPLFPKEGTSANPVTSSKLIQEKLSQYLDIIETSLSQQVATQAQAFFGALSSRHALQSQLALTLDALGTLRDRLKQIDLLLVKSSLQVLQLQKRRLNMQLLFHKLHLMSTVQQTQPTVQQILSTGDYVGALDLMATTQEVLTQELPGAHAFRHLGSQLVELQSVIERMMQQDFQRSAACNLNRPLSHHSKRQEDEELLEQDRLVGVVFGMLRLRSFQFVDVMCEEACTAIRALAKQRLAEAVWENDSEGRNGFQSVGVADDIETDTPGVVEANGIEKEDCNVPSLSFPQWLYLVDNTQKSLLVVLRRIKALVDVIIGAVEVAGGKSPPTDPMLSPTSLQLPTDFLVSPPDVATLRVRLEEVLQTCSDCAHQRLARVLGGRDRTERVTARELLALTKVTLNFMDGTEEIFGKRSTALRLALQGQVTRFVTRFHEERRAKLTLLLDAERWKQADVPYEFQVLADHMKSNGLILPHHKSGSDSPDHKKPPASMLLVDGEKFAVVGTVLMVFKMVCEYGDAAMLLQSAAPELLSRLCDLLRQFNSKCCQLVLGAGALHRAGLRTITSSNLALSSRSLQLAQKLVQHATTHFSPLLLMVNGSTTLPRALESVNKDFEDHQHEIETKLSAIIGSMTEQQLLSWEVKPPSPSPTLTGICRQITKLHEAVAPVLPRVQMERLFHSVNSTILHKIRTRLVQLKIPNNGGPQYGVVISELTFYLQTLRGLRVLTNLDDNAFFTELWSS